MKQFSLPLMLLAVIAACSEQNQKELISEITKSFASEPGVFALAYKNLDSQETIFINEKEHFHAASTMKTPVMIEIYKQSEEGNFQLSDSIFVKDEFYSIVDSSIYRMDIGQDSEGRLYEKVGQKLPIRDLMYEMITMSSNLATNILIDLVDARKVTATMRSMGADDINVLRGVEDLKAFDKGLSNSTTALDLLIIFDKLATGSLISAKANQEMINVLTAQHFNDIIPLYIPKDITVAHKTGSITGVHHDSGIVYLPDGSKYILVLLSKEMKDFDKGTDMLAKVSKMIYDYHTAK